MKMIMKRKNFRWNSIFIIVVIVASISLTVGCDLIDKITDKHRIVYLYNNSDRDIIVVQSGCEPLTISHYPSCFAQELVPAHSNKEMATTDAFYSCWEDVISNYPGRAAFFILDADSVRALNNDTTINRKPMNDVEQEELDIMYDKRTTIKYFYYSILDLNKMNWTITYP